MTLYHITKRKHVARIETEGLQSAAALDPSIRQRLSKQEIAEDRLDQVYLLDDTLDKVARFTVGWVYAEEMYPQKKYEDPEHHSPFDRYAIVLVDEQHLAPLTPSEHPTDAILCPSELLRIQTTPRVPPTAISDVLFIAPPARAIRTKQNQYKQAGTLLFYALKDDTVPQQLRDLCPGTDLAILLSDYAHFVENRDSERFSNLYAKSRMYADQIKNDLEGLLL